jgi:hypothetical protein
MGATHDQREAERLSERQDHAGGRTDTLAARRQGPYLMARRRRPMACATEIPQYVGELAKLMERRAPSYCGAAGTAQPSVQECTVCAGSPENHLTEAIK